MIQLCTEGLGGEQTQAVWDLLTNSDGGDLEGSIVPDIAMNVRFDVKTATSHILLAPIPEPDTHKSLDF